MTSISLIGFVTLSNAKNAITLEASTNLENLALYKASELDRHINRVETAVGYISAVSEIALAHQNLNDVRQVISSQDFATDMKFIVDESFNDLAFVHATFLVTNPDVLSGTPSYLFIHQDDGSFKSTSPSDITKNISVHSDSSNWFHLPLLRREGYWSDLVFDTVLKEDMVTYTQPLIVNDQLLGVVGVNMHFDFFESFVTNIEVFEHGYAFLLNRNHDNLIHPMFSKDTNMRTIDNGLFIPISNKINTSDYGIQRYHFYGKEKIMAYAHLHNGWILGLSPTITDLRSGLTLTKNRFYTLLTLSIIVLTLMGLVALRLLLKKINTGTPSEDDSPDQSQSFDELLTKNHTLNTTISRQQDDIQLIKGQLKTTQTALDHAQQTIIELREQKMIIDLVQHITNKLSNPIATSMTAASYLIEKSRLLSESTPENKQVDISNSAKLISNNQQQMKTILDSLKQLTMGLNLEEPRHFPIKAQVHHTVSNELSVHSNNTIQLAIDGDDQLMVFLPIDMFSKLMSDLTHHAIRVSKTLESGNIHIKLYKDEHFAHIIYHDLIPWRPGLDDRIFNPYYQEEFDKDGCGLELYIIKHTVTKIFLGAIDPFETDKGYLGFHIKLPIS
jgi:methyl-accepting chemotaxis protein